MKVEEGSEEENEEGKKEEEEEEAAKREEAKKLKSKAMSLAMEVEDDIPTSEKDNIYFFDGMDYSEHLAKQKKKDSAKFDELLNSEPVSLPSAFPSVTISTTPKKATRGRLTEEVWREGP
jgi:hypothetical protein